MRTRIVQVLLFFSFVSCGELQQVIHQLPGGGEAIGEAQIAAALQQALDQGIDRQVVKLAAENGFYGDSRYRILLPEPLQKVDKTLRDLGMGNLADEGLRLLNRAAEDAVGTATPIFVDAVRQITFADARNILLGPEDAATNYLQSKTRTALYGRFSPMIEDSFRKVGATRVWEELIGRYNRIPLVEPVNPDLTDYVTGEALKGVYGAIASEEARIRSSVPARSTELMRQVFALQDTYREGR
jgi:hypothetical protein